MGRGTAGLQFRAACASCDSGDLAALLPANPATPSPAIVDLAAASQRTRLALPRAGRRPPGRDLYAYRVEGPRDRRAGTASIRRRSCSIRSPRRALPARLSIARAAAGPGRPTAARRSACCRDRVPRSTEGELRRATRTTSSIYELHVKGFTARANSGVPADEARHFAGLVEKIPYLQELGVTVVELLPVHQFDPAGGQLLGLHDAELLRAASATTPQRRRRFDEFRAMVRAFHAAGIEVWLDVVYNHTTEGDDDRADLQLSRASTTAAITCSRPIDGSYINDTGCGNTLRTRRTRRAARWSSTACATGRDEHARRRLPLRPRVDLRARAPTARSTLDEPPIIAEISALAQQADVRADRRGVGHRQLPARPQLSRLHLAAMERQVPRRRARVREGRRRPGRRADAAAVRQRRSVPRQPARRAIARTRASTSSPRTTASACTIWSPTTRSTTRPTATATPTAPTTT